MTLSAPIFQTRSDLPPSPLRLGLTIQRDGDSPVSVGGELWISGVLALNPEDLTADNHEQWMRSVFVSVTSLKNQRPFCSNLVKDQMLFSNEVRQGLLEGGQPVALSSFRFELFTVLQHPLPEETYFIELSARQYRSNIFVQDVI